MSGLPSPVRAAGWAVRATGRMTVFASSLVYTELLVPHPARLSLDYFSDEDHPTPRFSRGPKFGAIVLVSEEHPNETYMAARLPKSEGAVQRLISIGPKLCQLHDFCKVPAGNYRLYVVTKDPLSVQIEFDGLPARSEIRPTSKAAGEISGATESYFYSSPPGEVEVAAHGAGFSPKLTGESNYMFSAFWFRGPQDPFGPPPTDYPLAQVGDVGSCFYFGAPPADAYAPGCPGGDTGHNFVNLYALRHFGYMHWGSIAPLDPGEFGRGDYAVHTGIHDPGFVGFWVDLTS